MALIRRASAIEALNPLSATPFGKHYFDAAKKTLLRKNSTRISPLWVEKTRYRLGIARRVNL